MRVRFTSAADGPPPQDYASLSQLEIVVRASLVLHSAAKNMVLGTPDTDVSSSSSSHGGSLPKEKAPSLIALPPPCLLPGESHSVPREHSGTAQWRPLVDHTGRCADRRPYFSPAGVPALEGEFSSTRPHFRHEVCKYLMSFNRLPLKLLRLYI